MCIRDRCRGVPRLHINPVHVPATGEPMKMPDDHVMLVNSDSSSLRQVLPSLIGASPRKPRREVPAHGLQKLPSPHHHARDGVGNVSLGRRILRALVVPAVAKDEVNPTAFINQLEIELDGLGPHVIGHPPVPLPVWEDPVLPLAGFPNPTRPVLDYPTIRKDDLVIAFGVSIDPQDSGRTSELLERL